MTTRRSERDSGKQLARYIHGAVIDKILLRQATTCDLPLTIYFHHDGLGSTVALTDSTGAVVESYTYDVYGQPSILSATYHLLPTSSVTNRFLFTGREYLPEPGLYDYRHRFYSPSLGRFLQTDSLRFDAEDVNLYRYCANNPVNFIDLFGLRDVVIQFYHNMTETELPAAAQKEVERIYLDAFNKYGKTKEHTLKFEWRYSEECPKDTGYSGGNLFGFNPTQVRFFLKQANNMKVIGYNPRRWTAYINAKGVALQAANYVVGMGVTIAHETGLHGIANKTDLSGANKEGFVDTSWGSPSSGAPVFSPAIGKAIMNALDLD